MSNKEFFYSWLICFVCAPFLFSALFMIPFIGQMLFFASVFLSVYYIYVRRSLKLAVAYLMANLLFIIPTMITMQLVSNKNRFEVTLFILIAACIPVSIIYTVTVAARAWYIVESKYGEMGTGKDFNGKNITASPS